MTRYNAELYEIEEIVNMRLIISNLPPKKRVVMQMCKYGLKAPEIAEILGISRRRVTQIYNEVYKEHFAE